MRTIVLIISCFFIVGCESVRYVQSEVSGSAKPAGGITEKVPITKSYSVRHSALVNAARQILDEEGYFYSEDSSSGVKTFKTEPKAIGDSSGFAGAIYLAKLQIKIDRSRVSYRALFDKDSNITMDEKNIEFPEKENEMRKAFFLNLDRHVGVTAVTPQAIVDITELQKKLLQQGYNPGPVDGIMGGKTVSAIKAFQGDNGLPVTGQMDRRTTEALGLD